MASKTPSTTSDATIADIPDKATPLEPGPACLVPTSNGSTFAERRAARQAGENRAVQASESKQLPWPTS